MAEWIFQPSCQLKALLGFAKNAALTAAAAPPNRELSAGGEDRMVKAILDDFLVEIELDLSARYATTKVDADPRGVRPPRTQVVYHIPASGGLGWLQGMPEGAKALPCYVHRSAPPPSSKIFTPYTGELTYEVFAAMDSGEHNLLARNIAEAVRDLATMVNDEIRAFRLELDAELRQEIAARRATSATVAGLDVPLVD